MAGKSPETRGRVGLPNSRPGWSQVVRRQGEFKPFEQSMEASEFDDRQTAHERYDNRKMSRQRRRDPVFTPPRQVKPVGPAIIATDVAANEFGDRQSIDEAADVSLGHQEPAGEIVLHDARIAVQVSQHFELRQGKIVIVEGPF